MSADNWAVCPYCEDARADALLNLEGDLRESYGTIPREEWEQKRIRYDDAKAIFDGLRSSDEMSFREDWEIGLIDGTFRVVMIYKGGCRTCGAHVNADYTLTVEKP